MANNRNRRKDLTADEKLDVRQRSFEVYRSYEYDIHELDSEGKKVLIDNPPTPEEWIADVTAQWEFILKETIHGAFITHDKDILRDGSPKPLHMQGLFVFKNPRYVGAMMKKLGISSVDNISPIDNFVGAYRYLLHITDEAIKDGKYIYAQDELTWHIEKSNDEDDDEPSFHDLIRKAEQSDTLKKIEKKGKVLVYELHEKVINGELAPKFVKDKLISQLGYDSEGEPSEIGRMIAMELYITHRERFERDVYEYMETKAEQLEIDGRDLKNFYITGAGNMGKSTIARELGKRKVDDFGMHVAAIPGEDKTYDFVSGYKAQKVTMIDEANGSKFNPGEFNGNFDPAIYNKVNSRNIDKDWISEYCYFAHSTSLEEFIKRSMGYTAGGSQYGESGIVETEDGQLRKEFVLNGLDSTKDMYFQMFRRFYGNIELKGYDEKQINVFVYRVNKELRGKQFQGVIRADRDFGQQGCEDKKKALVDEIELLLESEPWFDGKVLYDKHLSQNKDITFRKYEYPDIFNVEGKEITEPITRVIHPDNPFEK